MPSKSEIDMRLVAILILAAIFVAAAIAYILHSKASLSLLEVEVV